MSGGTKENNKNKDEIPLLVGWMRGAYLCLPKNVSMILVCVSLFSALRISVNYWIVEVLGWPESHQMTIESVSFLPPVMHSVLLCPVLYQLLTCQRYRPVSRMDEYPLWWQQTVSACMDLCTAYMIYDGIFLLLKAHWYHEGILSMQDYMYLGHHFATSLYMASTRIIGAGQSSAMMLMFLGEFTNPFQNLYCFIRFAVQIDSTRTIWHSLLPASEFLFAIFYAFFRTFLGPGAMAHITYHLIFPSTPHTIPTIITIIYLIMGWGVLIGSIGWTTEAIEMALDGFHIVKYHKDYDYGPGYEL